MASYAVSTLVAVTATVVPAPTEVTTFVQAKNLGSGVIYIAIRDGVTASGALPRTDIIALPAGAIEVLPRRASYSMIATIASEVELQIPLGRL